MKNIHWPHIAASQAEQSSTKDLVVELSHRLNTFIGYITDDYADYNTDYDFNQPFNFRLVNELFNCWNTNRIF